MSLHQQTKYRHVWLVSANKLVLNLEKTNITKFVTINEPYCALTVIYKDKCIEEAVNLKFLGIQIDSHLNSRNHTDQIIPKLCVACYMVRQMYHICNNDILRSLYLAYFHTTANYGIILWGISSYSRKIFTLQKRIIWIMMGAHPRTSCRELFKKLEILTIPSQYIYLLVSFFIGYQDKFLTNSSVHSKNTRNKHHLHRPIANLSCFQKGAYYSGIRIFNNLPQSITSLRNEKPQFKAALIFLCAHSFYSVDEFFACTDDLYYWLTWLCQFWHCNNFICFVCFWHVPHPIVWWQPQGSMECIYVCMYVCMYVYEDSAGSTGQEIQYLLQNKQQIW